MSTIGGAPPSCARSARKRRLLPCKAGVNPNPCADADSFQAMLSQRPYRNAMTFDAAIEELRRCSGSQFDPDVVTTFVKTLTEGRGAGGCRPDHAARILGKVAHHPCPA